MEEVGAEVSFIAEKIDELKELTPQVADFVKDTKDAFVDDELNDKVTEIYCERLMKQAQIIFLKSKAE